MISCMNTVDFALFVTIVQNIVEQIGTYHFVLHATDGDVHYLYDHAKDAWCMGESF